MCEKIARLFYFRYYVRMSTFDPGYGWNGAGFLGPADSKGSPLPWSSLSSLLDSGTVGTLKPVRNVLSLKEKGASRIAEECEGGIEQHGTAAQSAVPFAELHASSNYSFLIGASSPADMVRAAQASSLSALALLERDGLYSAVQCAEAAAQTSVGTIFGAELTLSPSIILPLVVTGSEGYRRLSRTISDAALAAGSKGQRCYPSVEELADIAQGHWIVLVDASHDEELITRILAAFGHDNVFAELPATGQADDYDHHVRLRATGARCIISTRPRAATKGDARVAAAKQALHNKQHLGAAQGQLHPLGATWIKSGASILRRYPDCADAVAATIEVAERCTFELDLATAHLPPFPVPEGTTEISWLRQLCEKGWRRRYGGAPADVARAAWLQAVHELDVIEQLGFPGYFLIVHDLTEFARRNTILCQGRGSAANSVVCFCLGITNVEPIANKLLFERFLSAERDGPPDIDIDFESGRREEVIQYVYQRYGRNNAAQVANVITYRTKGAIRDAARALGYPQGVCDAWASGQAASQPPERVLELAQQLKSSPRHLGIHSGGMVICDRPIAEIVPVEWARKKGRSVIQWDKDDCAAAGLVKVDLLGLGMLEALHHAIDLVQEQHNRTIELWQIDCQDPKVYEMLSRADAVGVFQVESRAQLNTLPRLKPRTFFDLVVEVALIRPGPIQGGSVHPYIRRRNGLEPVTYDHPCLKPALEKTLGVPLFQEQLMQIAKDAAGFSGAEADSLRRAMGSKRSPERMNALKQRFFEGLKTAQGIEGATAEVLWNKMVAFASYGFPESHSQSFASLVFYSAWFKLYYPAEFCVALLRAQPMGFYSPQSLISDARRHGVKVLPVCVQASADQARVENGAIRLGLGSIKGVGSRAAQRIEGAAQDGPFSSIADVASRAGLSVAQAESLARAGAFACFGLTRRQALWEAGVAATHNPGMLPGIDIIHAPALPGMSELELLSADIASTGVTPDKQPMELLREALDARGVISADNLMAVEDGTRIWVAGVVTHRQRPKTAGGVTFLGMEDETGLINVVLSPGVWRRYAHVAGSVKTLMVRGIVRNASGAVSIDADALAPLHAESLSRGSRDFR